jgi:alkanesulfonate monooxygenase SsuD/methylene tetrahydromethanopterin reductase-like flavin-dependent oxidoreductase (luciferase family)
MWLWITESSGDAERVLAALAQVLGREDLRPRVCVGSAEHCAELLRRYLAVGCQRMHFWPVADEPRQLSLLADRVLPQLT